MIPAELYLTAYSYGLLTLTLLTALVYLRSGARLDLALGYNRTMLPIIGGLMILFIGLRPLSWVFVDMGAYAMMHTRAMAGEKVTGDWAFDQMLIFFSMNFSVEYFFLFAALLYIAPLAYAAARHHGEWGLGAFLALLGGFSFFNYGVNGIRHGIAASLVIAVFSLHNRRVAGLLLALIACMFHKSAIIPLTAFLVARWVPLPGLWAGLWITTTVTVGLVGERINVIISNFLPVFEDERFQNYLLTQGEDKGGYRWDFLLYSSLPVIVSYILATPAAKDDKGYRSLLSTYIITNAFWVLVIYAAYSNRFAYLSWSFLPWVVMYPFIGSRHTNQGGTSIPVRSGLLAAALVGHFAFTFIMNEFVYSR